MTDLTPTTPIRHAVPIRFDPDEIPDGYLPADPDIGPPLTDDDAPEPEDVPPPPKDGDAEDAPDVTAAFLGWAKRLLGRIEGTQVQTPWCPKWWQHTEVVDRLFTLWRAHVESIGALDQRAASSWWVDHWDRHAHTLFAKDGPFRDCTRDTHLRHNTDQQPAIPYTAPPTGWRIPGDE